MMKTSACPLVWRIAESASHRAAVVKSIGTSAVTLGGNAWWMSKRCVTVTGIPAFFAAFSCGWRKYGFGAAWRSIRSTFWAIAWLIPVTHWEGWPWVGNSMNLTPIFFATACIAWSIVLTNGIALEIGMSKTVFPAAFFASKAGPG